VHVANPQEEALKKEVEALRNTIADLQVVVQTIEKEKSDNEVKAPAKSKRCTKEELPLEKETSVSDFSTNESLKEEKVGVVVEHHSKQNAPAVINAAAEATAQVNARTEKFCGPPSLRVKLKPTEVVTNLLQAAHTAEINALEHLLSSSTNENHVETAETWRAYQAFRRRYDCLLHGDKTANANTEEEEEEDNQEGCLLHFLGLPQDLDDNQAEIIDIKAIEDIMDWRDDAKESLLRYRDARLSHIQRVEDAVFPRLEALRVAGEDDKDIDEEDDVDLEKMTKDVLFTHVLHPFSADPKAFESFVHFVARALERPGPNKSAIRPFQNALKAMATTTEQADLYKSWITDTRRTGILIEKAAAKAAAPEAADEHQIPEQAPVKEQLVPKEMEEVPSKVE
jgi:hypothetical protein